VISAMSLDNRRAVYRQLDLAASCARGRLAILAPINAHFRCQYNIWRISENTRGVWTLYIRLVMFYVRWATRRSILAGWSLALRGWMIGYGSG